MRNAVLVRRPDLAAALLAGGALVALVLLWGADSPLSRLLRLDLSFMALPVALCGLLLALGRLALWMRGSEFAERVTLRVRVGRGGVRLLPLAEVLPVAHRLLTDLGWTALGLGLLSGASDLPALVSGLPWVPDVASLSPYLRGFDSLAAWGILLLAPFIAARAVAEVRPSVAAVVGFPRVHLAAFGAAYALLGVDGALSAAFALSGAWALLAVGLAVGLSYAASVIRRALVVGPPARVPRLRRALLVTEAAWIVALWIAIAVLALAAESASVGPGAVGPGSVDPSYLAVLYSPSVVQVLAVLLPFALVHYWGVLRPGVARILGTPIGRLAALAVVYVVFSGSGLLSTAFGVDVSGMLTALLAAVLLSYAATVLRNVATLDVPQRYALLTANASRVLGALAVAAGLAVVVGAALAHLPAANAVLLDRPGTTGLGEDLLPFLGGFHEARYSIAWLSFAATAMVLLPRVLSGQPFLRYRPILSAVSYFAVGCLTWLTASGLSSFGHGFTFGGAVATAGMFSLALTRLAPYASSSSNPAVADVAGWLAASQVRGFTFGAALAFYVLLLRPVVYEMLWLAALYEYTALLVLLLAVLMNVVNRLRVVAGAREAPGPGWADWSHHRQVLESKADPRAALTDAMRRRFVDHGDWRPLWVYLLGLLYRSDVSADAMAAVCRSLRRGAVTPLAWNVLGRKRRTAARTAALEHALDAAGWALASSAPQLERMRQDDVRRAGASYVQRGTDPEPLAVALIVAHCQRGDRPEEAVDRWFSLLDTADPFLEWLTRWRSRSNTRVGAALRRQDLVDEAVASIFEAPVPSGPAPSRGPALGHEGSLQ